MIMTWESSALNIFKYFYKHSLKQAFLILHTVKWDVQFLNTMFLNTMFSNTPKLFQSKKLPQTGNNNINDRIFIFSYRMFHNWCLTS